MRFGEMATRDARGGFLAHSLRPGGGARVPKGALVDAALVERLLAAGVERVMAVLIDGGDVHEDAAAARLAESFAGDAVNELRRTSIGSGLRVGRASTGRANVFAAHDGLFLFDREAVLGANGVDEGITLATLAENLMVPAGRMVATIKIVPFAVRETALGKACAALAGRAAGIRPPTPHRVALVQTVLPSLSERALHKTRRVTEARLTARSATLAVERRCAHTVESLTSELARLPPAIDWVLIVGASAIADRRDVIPAAVERLGGTVKRLGLAVDPGNLLMLGGLGGRTVLGLPGCARSPADNGVDRLLDRLACGIGIDDAWLRSLAIGGLLDAVVGRPSSGFATDAPGADRRHGRSRDPGVDPKGG